MFGLGKAFLGGEPRAQRPEVGAAWGASNTTVVPALGAGLAGGTIVATATGWRPAEAIAKGDLVLTFDRGMQAVTKVTRTVACVEDAQMPCKAWPLHVPEGALGNTVAMTLLPDQAVMLESDAAEVLYGDPFTLVDASDLEGFRGIERVCPDEPMEIVMLHFEQDEVVFVSDGALAFCPAKGVISLDTILAGEERGGYFKLDTREAAHLVECLKDEDAVDDGLWPDAREEEPYAAFG